MCRKMKDSGIEWIGKIPENWMISKLKYFIKVKSGAGISKDEFSDAGAYSVIGSNGEIGRASKSNLIEERLVVGRVGAVGSLNIVKCCWVTDNALIVINEDEVFSTKYLYYTLHNVDFLAYNTGTAQPLMTGTQLRDTIVPLISLKEQNRIVNYLDKKCEKVNQTIEKQKQVIEKLKAYKQSVITEAVTKGLNPDVSMKDSGIEWIGEIPEHWNVVQMSRILKERKCKNQNNIENNVLSLSYGSIKRRNVETNMGLLPESFETYNIVEKGNIVLRLTDLQNDHKSLRCGLVNERGIITSAYVTLEHMTNVNTNYYYRLLHTFDIMKGFYGMGDGVRQNLKFNGELNKLLLILPPILEQNTIADYLDKKCSQIDNIIIQKESLIQKLTEYKKSLIYECVTGKREV